MLEQLVTRLKGQKVTRVDIVGHTDSMVIAYRSQHIFIGQSTNPPLSEVSDTEIEILAGIFTDVTRKAKAIQLILKKYAKP